MPEYTWKKNKKNSAEYDHCQTFKMERFAKSNRGVGGGGTRALR